MIEYTALVSIAVILLLVHVGRLKKKLGIQKEDTDHYKSLNFTNFQQGMVWKESVTNLASQNKQLRSDMARLRDNYYKEQCEDYLKEHKKDQAIWRALKYVPGETQLGKIGWLKNRCLTEILRIEHEVKRRHGVID